jgi:hypothetical protein
MPSNASEVKVKSMSTSGATPTHIAEAGSRTRRRSCIAVKSISEPTGDGRQRHKNAKCLGT